MYKCGLIGRSILASRSPWLHEQEARAQGIALTYDLFDFTDRRWPDDELGPLLRRLAAEGYSGVNVTFPFKQMVIDLLDETDESAQAVGAVNTVAMHGEKLIGYNTDMAGFRDSLANGLPDRGMGRVLLLGAGGAGAAVANALLTLGDGKLAIFDQDYDRATELARALGLKYGKDRVSAVVDTDEFLVSADGIVNATPMGMASKPGAPIDTDKLWSKQWVADIVYFPLETELLRRARERGCRTLDGSGMVVGQAARAFEIFTGRVAAKARMRASFSAKE